MKRSDGDMRIKHHTYLCPFPRGGIIIMENLNRVFISTHDLALFFFDVYFYVISIIDINYNDTEWGLVS